MRTIQRQISLENVISRLPSVWPSYRENESKLYCFGDDSLRERSYEYTSNWGMVPVNIVLNHNPKEGWDYDEYKITSSIHCYGGDFETSSGCSNSGTSSYDKLDKFVLSFENLSHWYHFFTQYYNLLKGYGHCGRVYTSAEDYYNYESLTKYADQMIYGSDKQTYLNLDKEFAEKGGIVEVQIYNKDTSEYSATTPSIAHDELSGDRMAMTDVYDIGFFKWICINVVPSFTIPMKYKDYWKKDKLYYPDVIKWLAWFGTRLSYEDLFSGGTSGETDLWDCKQSGVTDCCECEDYFNRGGARIYSAMSDWYEDVQEVIGENDSDIKAMESCFVPTIISPIELQLSIDDLGNFDIFSKDFELGKDYRVTRLGYENNDAGGTVITIDGKPMYLSEDMWGYSFDKDCMEKYVSECITCGYRGVFSYSCPKCGSKNITQTSMKDYETVPTSGAWTSYTDRYISHKYCCSTSGNGICIERYNNGNEFNVSAVTYYTYNKDNVRFTTSKNSKDIAIADLKSQLAKKYPITHRENGWMLINNNIYEINKAEYGTYYSGNTYLSGNTYIVLREEGTSTPYTYINGKKVFAEFYPLTNKYYFPFFMKGESEKFNINDYITYDRLYNSADTLPYVEYNGNVYIASSSTISIDGNDAYAVSGYALSDNDEVLYCLSGSNEVVYNGYGVQKYPNSSADTEYITVEYVDDFEVYTVDEITGRTVSKINDLRLYNVLTDDIGNNIEGIYDCHSENVFNHQPPEGTELELIYQVGNTANITRFSQTENDIVSGTNYFVGDIITEMDFYYKDFSDERVSVTLYTVRLLGNDMIELSGATTSTTVPASSYTSLSAITYSTSAKTELESGGTLMHDDIYCDITYYKGATLSRKSGCTYNLGSIERGDDCKNHGVEYKETVRFVKTNYEYYLKKPSNTITTLPSKRNNPCKHSISYPVYVYVLTQDMERVDESQYDVDYSVPMANFRTDINIFSGNGDTYGVKYSGDMETHNNMEVFPIFRKEYNLGMASIENVNSDIYIDRGINAAFEKHLKLGEVTSLEALEQYGNNYFKFMES